MSPYLFIVDLPISPVNTILIYLMAMLEKNFLASSDHPTFIHQHYLGAVMLVKSIKPIGILKMQSAFGILSIIATYIGN